MARSSAIPPDELLDKPLGELSASDLLSALSGATLDQGALAILPDKKKYELWVEESGLPKLRLGDFIERLRGEKKKLELEKFNIENVKMIRESQLDVSVILRDPEFIDQVAEKVATRINRG